MDTGVIWVRSGAWPFDRTFHNACLFEKFRRSTTMWRLAISFDHSHIQHALEALVGHWKGHRERREQVRFCVR
ncbi:hypothetical protein ASG25_18780 [Rhizobium sp. Leaf384]|nr:hypothetical protein ASG25_18780 [Rhizobium sp. Leaf384]KQS78485.1 hypothetical protein ASG58_09050 [Rhizobium sp. Leaf383]